jgi:hypothetical protein
MSSRCNLRARGSHPQSSAPHRMWPSSRMSVSAGARPGNGERLPPPIGIFEGTSVVPQNIAPLLSCYSGLPTSAPVFSLFVAAATYGTRFRSASRTALRTPTGPSNSQACRRPRTLGTSAPQFSIGSLLAGRRRNSVAYLLIVSPRPRRFMLVGCARFRSRRTILRPIQAHARSALRLCISEVGCLWRSHRAPGVSTTAKPYTTPFVGRLRASQPKLDRCPR